MAKTKSGKQVFKNEDEDAEDTEEEGADKENLNDDEEEVDEEDEDEDEDEEDDDDEPSVRRNLSHIIARKNRKIEKLESKQRPAADEEDDDGEDEQKVARRVGDVAQSILGPMARDLDRKQIDIDISTFLADPRNAKFRKYEKKARRWAAHPSRSQLPVSSIFKEIAFDDFAAGAEDDSSQKRDRADRTSARGNSFRNPPKSDTEKIQGMNFRSKEFQSLRERIGAGETIDLSQEE